MQGIPKYRIHPRRLGKSHPEWVKIAVRALWLLRDGVDYYNTNKRYDKAHALFDKAYPLAVQAGASNYDLARICLWNGISLNENKDLDIKVRNALAIELYLQGIKHAKKIEGDDAPPLLASLYNSLGVAYHHISRRDDNDRFDIIPKKCIKYYTMSRDLFMAHPEIQRRMIRVMKKVESNSGWRVTRPGIVRPHRGGGEGWYGGNCS